MTKQENKNFEQFLKEKHSENYTGTDDNMSDNFELWLTELGVDELIDYADKFEQVVREETIEIILKNAKEVFTDFNSYLTVNVDKVIKKLTK